MRIKSGKYGLRSDQKTLLRPPNFQNFLGGEPPQTPLQGLAPLAAGAPSAHPHSIVTGPHIIFAPPFEISASCFSNRHNAPEPDRNRFISVFGPVWAFYFGLRFGPRSISVQLNAVYTCP